MKTLGFIALAYVGLLVFFFAVDMTEVVALLLMPFYWLYELGRRLWKPLDYRVERALAALKQQLLANQPAVVETRVELFLSQGPPMVYLVCLHETDEPVLRQQLQHWHARIARMLQTQGYRGSPPVLEFRAASRDLVEREGGWWAYIHNVS